MPSKYQTLTLEARCDEMIQYAYSALRQFPKHEKHVLGAARWIFLDIEFISRTGCSEKAVSKESSQS